MPNPRNIYLSSFTQALPVLLGYLPVGFGYGVLAAQGGLTGFQTILMSLIVYAGSAQFIAVGMISAVGAGSAALNPVSIALTTFVVNLRHLLMSASLAPHLKHWKPLERILMASEMTDETFGIHSLRFAKGDDSKPETFMINLLSHAAWVLASCLGFYASTLLHDTNRFGLDFALAGMFIALICMQIRNGMTVLIGVISASTALALHATPLREFGVILATAFAATLGVIFLALADRERGFDP